MARAETGADPSCGVSFPLVVESLVKRYGDRGALNGVSLTIPPDVGCLAVLGRNGAGKTTLVRVASGVLHPTSGSVEIFGLSLQDRARHLKGMIGVMPQGESLDHGLNVLDNIVSHGAYHGIRKSTARARAHDLLELVALGERADAHVWELSGGMQRRLLYARALINEPRLLFLDEPTTGLDPQSQQHVWELVRTAVRRGTHAVLTTNNMEEASRLADYVVILEQGRVVAKGLVSDLCRKHVRPWTVEFSCGEPDAAHRLSASVSREGCAVEVIGTRVVLGVDSEREAREAVSIADLDERDVIIRLGNLEDVFMALTGRALSENEI